jgi:hypothetical protein
VTPSELSAIRARVEAAPVATSTQIEIDRDSTTRWINVGPFPCSSREEAASVRNLVTLIHAAPTDLRALIDEVERLRAERDTAKNHLSTLLARIFRDGGHRAAQSGIEQSVDVADKLVAELYREVDEGFARGAEAMLESLAMAVIGPMAPAIRALPLPEDK